MLSPDKANIDHINSTLAPSTFLFGTVWLFRLEIPSRASDVGRFSGLSGEEWYGRTSQRRPEKLREIGRNPGKALWWEIEKIGEFRKKEIFRKNSRKLIFFENFFYFKNIWFSALFLFLNMRIKNSREIKNMFWIS